MASSTVKSSPTAEAHPKQSASPPPTLSKEEGASSDRSEGEVSEENPPLPYEDNLPLPYDEAPPLPDEPVPDAEDDGWEFRVDHATGRYYFYNNKTGVSQWENPRVPETTTNNFASYNRFANDFRLIFLSPV